MTLLEVLIAVAVATVGMFGALAILTTVTKGGQFSRTATEASVLAQARLEEMVSVPVTLTAPVDGAYSHETKLDPMGNVTATGIYSRDTSFATTPDALRRIVTVTVTWADGNNKSHSVIASEQRDP